MHYCSIIITKEFPTDNVLEEILRPYNEDDYYSQDERQAPPTFMWDWWQVGGRYTGQIKLTIDKDDEEYQWCYMAKEPRAGRLFRSSTLEHFQFLSNKNNSFYFEEDYFPSMGYRDGFLYVDGGRVKDIQNLEELGCFNFIDKDGRAFTRSYYDGQGNFIDNADFDKQFMNALKNSQDCYICVVDIHD